MSETYEYTLKAMALNYRDGHSWDELDGRACIGAASEIKTLKDSLTYWKARALEAESAALYFSKAPTKDKAE